MARYQIWNKTDDILCSTGTRFTAAEYIAAHPIANYCKMIVGAPPITGAVFLEFETTKAEMIKRGCPITNEMTDEQVLAAIEYFEDNPPELEPSAEERIAAAMEYQNVMNY